MCITELGILRGETSCSLCHIQMSSSLEVIWSWKDNCFWSYHSDNSFFHWGKVSSFGCSNIRLPFLVYKITIYCLLILLSPQTSCNWLDRTDVGYLFILSKVPDNNDVLAYWLSNSSTLLLLLQHTLKASGAASLTPQRRRTSSASLFGRMSQVNLCFIELSCIF